MMNTNKLYSVEHLKSGHHVSLMYRTDEEHRAAVIPFLRQGLEAGEKVLYVNDTNPPDVILDRLRDEGLAIEQFLASGQFSIISSDDAYMRNGVFNPHRVIDTLWDERGRALSRGYPSLRMTSEMSWAIHNPEIIDQLIDYEAELNRFFPSRAGYGNCLAICQYDLRVFPPDVLLKILKTHPILITGKTVCDNHHYLPPDDFFSPDRDARSLLQKLTVIREQRREQERIQKSEDQFRSIYTNAPLGLQLYGQNKKLVSANRTCLEIFGVTDLSVMEEFNLLQNFNLTNKVLEKSGDGNTVRFETTIDFSRMNFLNLVDSRKSGVMYLDVMVTEIMPGDNGFRGGYLVCIQDITRRKKNEKFLKKSEDRFRSVVEVASDAIISCDSAGTVISWNNGAEVMFGFPADDITGQPVRNIIASDARTDFDAAVKRVSTLTKSPANGENSFESSGARKTGIDFPCEITLSKWKAGSGDFFTIIIRDISKRKEIESDLRKKESAISSSINPIALLDLQSTITYINPSFLSSWGYDTSAEVIGRPATSFWQSPAESSRTLATTPGKGWIGELQAHRKDRSTFTVQLSSTIVADNNNRPSYVVASFVDLSSVEPVQKNGHASNGILSLMNVTGEMVTLWDNQLRLTDLNPPALGWFSDEKPKEQLIGSDLFSVFACLDNTSWKPKFEGVVKTGKQLVIENVRPPGKKKNTYYTLSVSRYDGGLCIVLSDRAGTKRELEELTGQLSALSVIEETMRKTKDTGAALSTIVNTAVNLVRYGDKAGTCIRIDGKEYTSERFGNFPWKTSAGIVSGGIEIGTLELSYNEQLPPRDLGPFSHAECQAIILAASLVGAHIPANIPDDAGSALKQEIFHEPEPHPVEFTLTMAREIKTRLTPILASSDMLASELSEEPWKELASTINRGTLKLDEKINAILDIASIESGTLSLDFKPVSVENLVEDVRNIMKPVTSAYHQSLVTDIPGKLPHIYGDRKRLLQILLSFVESAAKVTPSGKSIKINVRKKSHSLDFEVRDSSHGMTDEQVQLLEQSLPSEAGRESLNGLGFGLSISRKLIELHHGSMWIRVKKGKGNTFGFSLPLNGNQR